MSLFNKFSNDAPKVDEPAKPADIKPATSTLRADEEAKPEEAKPANG